MNPKFFLKTIFFFIVIGTFSVPCLGQYGDRTISSTKPNNPKQDSYFSKPIQLIDIPTASILRGGDMEGSIRLYEEGGALTKLSVGISKYFMLSVSYGGNHIIGGSSIEWNDMPGVRVAYRIIEENLKLPAVVLGFDSQGYGRWWPAMENVTSALSDSLSNGITKLYDRYSSKSRGFYIVVSKAIDPSLVRVGLHGGISYSLEKDQFNGDDDPTVFMAMDAQLSKDLAAIAEYDFATNDDKLADGKGYFNVGFRWAFSNSMFLEFDFKNILAGDNDFSQTVRVIKFSYTGSVK